MTRQKLARRLDPERARRVLERRLELPERRPESHDRERDEQDRLGEDEQPEGAVQLAGPVTRGVCQGDRRDQVGQREREIGRALEERDRAAAVPDRREGHRQREHDREQAADPLSSSEVRAAGQRYWRFPLAR